MISHKWFDLCNLIKLKSGGHQPKCILASLVCVFCITANAEIHPEVQAALDWPFPKYECERPVLKKSRVATTQTRKFQKAIKKFKACVDDYKQLLLTENDKLMAVASHGLTSAQAEIILGKIKVIQEILKRSAGGPTGKTQPNVENLELYDPQHGH